MIKRGIMLCLGLSGLCCSTNACASVAYMEKAGQPPREYQEWLKDLKEEMHDKGISSATIEQAFAKNYYHPKHKVVEKDRNQAEFIMSSTEYLNRLVNRQRVEKGKQKYKEIRSHYQKVEKNYGVPLNYLVAFWGMETNYGQSFGNHEVIEALTVLSYDNRRPQFFRNELYQALKIIDNGNITVEGMEGSWAGAMGHFQFMPSTYNAYAVDYDKDGKIDIWNNYGDAIASAANYLQSIGWKKGEPWGMEVTLPWNFDYGNSGRGIKKSIKDWEKLGVRKADGKKIGLNAALKCSIIVPEGYKGQAYLVLDNFDKIMQWNKSENYALGVSLLADYVKSGKAWQARQNKSQKEKISNEDILELQKFINRHKIAQVTEDGQLGSKTRTAIKKLQKKAGFPADGYPSIRLINKIKNFDEKIGFSVPLQPQKPHRKPNKTRSEIKKK